MAPPIRLRRSADVRTVFSDGAGFHGRAMVVHRRARPGGGPARWTVVAGRKVGGAVARNRAKRRLRAVLDSTELPPGVDLVVVAKAPAATTAFGELRSEAGRLLARSAPHAGALT